MTTKPIFFNLIIASFFSFQSCSNDSSNNNATSDPYLITGNSIGIIKLGETISDLKEKYQGYKFSSEPVWRYGVDGENNGVKVSKGNEDYIFVWTQENNDTIRCIIALNKIYHTLKGISPNFSTSGDLKSRLPNIRGGVSFESPNIEYFLDGSIFYIFNQKDSTYVGKYSVDDTEMSEIYDTTKILSWIQVFHDQE